MDEQARLLETWLIPQVSLWLLAQRRVSTLTHTSYIKDITKFCMFVHARYPGLQPATLTLSHVSAFLVHYSMGYAAATRARCAAALRIYARYLWERGIIPNIATHIQAGGAPRLVDRVIPVEKTDKLVAYVREILRTERLSWRTYQSAMSFILLYATGIRVSELITLRVTDISSDGKTIRVIGKRNKERIVPLASSLTEDIQIYVQQRALYTARKQDFHNPWLFNAVCGGATKKSVRKKTPARAVSRATVWRMINRLLLSHGLTGTRLGPHALRHTLASHLLAHNWNLRTIQTLLGHEQIATVQRYAHIDMRQLKHAYHKAHPRAQPKKK